MCVCVCVCARARARTRALVYAFRIVATDNILRFINTSIIDYYFSVSKQWYGCQCSGFLTRARMLMHAIAHAGCTQTVRESAPEVDSGRKIPCRTGDSNPRQYCAELFSRTLY